VKEDRDDIYCKEIKRKKKRRELINDIRVICAHEFVACECDSKYDEKRPGSDKRCASEIKYEKCREETSKCELHDNHGPEMNHFIKRSRGGFVRDEVKDDNSCEYNDKVPENPYVFPKHINSLECNSVKHESADKGEGRDMCFPLGVPAFEYIPKMYE
jgi:hypothetical protein